MHLQFHKMHGLGNDFIIIKDLIDFDELCTEQVKYMCNRHLGIGCDQLILCKKRFDDAKNFVKMRVYNADGSEASFCGNATRCVAALYLDFNNEDKNKDVFIETGNGLLNCKCDSTIGNNMITINIGVPVLDWNLIPLSDSIENNEISLPSDIEINNLNNLKGFCLNVGNPHIVIAVNNFDFDLKHVGEKIENLSYFPKKINVDFAQIVDRNNINLKVWERGAGLTLACGSGACASFYALYKKGLINESVKVIFPIGSLDIRLENGDILMTGSYTYVFSGNIHV